MNATIEQAPAGYVTVVAYRKGFYGVGKMGSRINKGETFFVPEGTRLGSWFGPVNQADMAKLKPSTKPEKQKAQVEANRMHRLAKDPAAFLQSMREFSMQNAAMTIAANRVLDAQDQPKQPPQPKRFDNPKA